MRTTVHIDDPILKDLKKIQEKERKSLGRLISDLLAQAPWERKPAKGSTSQSRRISGTMGARIELADREALYAAMAQGLPPTEGAKETWVLPLTAISCSMPQITSETVKQIPP